ncbi:branched-chain alpha-keto acid dehydrogenase subunit E2 [Geothermobacter hydrogeniphilus]|uniref:Dihydrolipoamide acetyltransferase component of pyruvate dehydrogenase complex n=1 Tax=Geothermobacter hydrogeniphilus TaxID=1969733 RepID=A0A2K2HBL6_9BACT|nr:2-oxo acid dehydrogenase subunit E2 [Geothermobacter hydrogeniphilus]PNU20704.1 branched-chain alpha-keto acid dehydrogenase subunit E2 [Geothermobacter hydrogeniphilus]
MKQEIKLPEVSEGVRVGTVTSLLVAVGDQVKNDQTLLELETDKAVVAIPSPLAGTISEIHISEGDVVEIGATLMWLETAGEAAETKAETGMLPETPPAEEPLGSPTETETTVPLPPPPLPPHHPTAAPVDLTGIRRDDRVAPASPTVRRMARELGVDIYQVQGSGPGGRISIEDVRAFVKTTMQRATGGGITPSEFPGLHAQRPLPDFSRFGTSTREPLSRIRELTADSMSYAWSTIPMVTQYDKAVVGPVEEFRQARNNGTGPNGKLTMTAILIKICAAALRVFPNLNSALDLAERELLLHDFINIGVAVDTPDGLLVPVLRNVDRKGIEAIAGELNDLADRTRRRRIKPEELEGGTFTISNLGGIGGTAFTPIVYPPQVAILGVSRSEMQPIWNGTGFEPQLVLPLSLSYDHRVIDGAAGARFLRWICETLEQPLNLVMKN